MELEVIFKDGRKLLLDSVERFTVSEESQVAETPTVGKRFLINPKEINKVLFEVPREDTMQEWARSIILQAFEEVENNPKYKGGKEFFTMIPEKTWTQGVKVWELVAVAKEVGGQVTDWVEMALEWAQRLSNGETWEKLSNRFDTVPCCRLIVWKTGYYRPCGWKQWGEDSPPANVGADDFCMEDQIWATVPSVTIRK